MSDPYGSDLRWWRYEGDALAANIHQAILQIRNRQWYRRESDFRHARLYGNYMTAGYGSSNSMRTSLLGGSYRLALNVCKNMTQAATAKVTKNRPKPMFLTSGGDYTEQKKAKLLTKFAEGQFYETNLYQLAPTVFLDACIYGTGILKIFEEQSEIKVDRVFPWEIIVDEEDGRDGKPRQLYQVQRVDKLVLSELFPGHEGEINKARKTDMFELETPEMGTSSYLSNLIQVYEAWHLPSGKGAKDGKHVISIDGAVLLSEPYEVDYYPFAMVRWTKAPMGFFGIGLCEELTGIQLEINALLKSIQQAHHLLGKSHWMVENASKVLSTHLDNDIGSIIRYTGTPPQVYTPTAVPPEIYRHLWELYAKSYEIAGISQLSAQSQKPAGLDSGRALRVFSDIQTERFVTVAREYESFFIETSRQMVELARRISEKDSTYTVRVSGKSAYQKIAWHEIDLKAEEYVMKVFPVSALSDDPSAKIEQAQELSKAGWIEPEEAMRLLDFPDIEQSMRRRFASHELIEDLIEQMIDKGEYTSPEPFMDLQDAIKTTQMSYLRAKLDKVPEENLELLRRFMSDAFALANPEPPPVPAGAMPLPPGPPMPEGPMGPPPGPEGLPMPMGPEAMPPTPPEATLPPPPLQPPMAA